MIEIRTYIESSDIDKEDYIDGLDTFEKEDLVSDLIESINGVHLERLIGSIMNNYFESKEEMLDKLVLSFNDKGNYREHLEDFISYLPKNVSNYIKVKI